MKSSFKSLIVIGLLMMNVLCYSQKYATNIVTGADQTGKYLPLIKGKTVGIVTNNSAVIHGRHLVDTLLALKIKIVKIFGPEHGFRGNNSDGAKVQNEVDERTGIPIVSLYGAKSKPTPEDLAGIDVMIFDIQDVGVRFYTYLSTMCKAMEACAENKIPYILLDRPNPNGFCIDGPILESQNKSFVGLHPVPASYGMTIGEYAQMANGEGWLKEDVKCNLTVIKLKNYTHNSKYKLPINPSPNLASMEAIYLYPSLCLFEGTVVSQGRGTDNPFTVLGHPLLTQYKFSFTPEPRKGISDNPPLKGQKCYGLDLTSEVPALIKSGHLELKWLIEMYAALKDKVKFFTPYFDRLAGSPKLREQVEAGQSAEQIRESWQPGLNKFKEIRKKYLLYPEK